MLPQNPASFPAPAVSSYSHQYHHQGENFFSLSRLFFIVAWFFAFGVSCLLLMAFYDALSKYSDVLGRVCIFAAVVMVLALTAYVVANVVLSLDYRATQVKIFKDSRQELLSSANHDREQEEQDEQLNILAAQEQRILQLYKENSSLNRIASEVYGNTGGVYNNKIKAVLAAYGLEI